MGHGENTRASESASKTGILKYRAGAAMICLLLAACAGPAPIGSHPTIDLPTAYIASHAGNALATQKTSGSTSVATDVPMLATPEPPSPEPTLPVEADVDMSAAQAFVDESITRWDDMCVRGKTITVRYDPQQKQSHWLGETKFDPNNMANIQILLASETEIRQYLTGLQAKKPLTEAQISQYIKHVITRQALEACMMPITPQTVTDSFVPAYRELYEYYTAQGLFPSPETVLPDQITEVVATGALRFSINGKRQNDSLIRFLTEVAATNELNERMYDNQDILPARMVPEDDRNRQIMASAYLNVLLIGKALATNDLSILRETMTFHLKNNLENTGIGPDKADALVKAWIAAALFTGDELEARTTFQQMYDEILK